jgi:HAD superfamily hydrolase (TIGR01509 family)
VFDFLGVIVPFGVSSGLSYLGLGKKQVVDERIVALMRDLADKDVHLAVASNSGLAWIESALSEVENMPAIDKIITPEDGALKPDVAYFQKLRLILDASVDTVLFIDDREVNCQAAKAAGFNAFWYHGEVGELRQMLGF